MEAKVIKLSGVGPERLRMAIEQGLVAGDVRRDYERTLAENDRLRRELGIQRGMTRRAEAARDQYRRERLAEYRDGTRRNLQKPYGRDMAFAGLMLGLCIGAVILFLAAVTI